MSTAEEERLAVERMTMDYPVHLDRLPDAMPTTPDEDQTVQPEPPAA